MNNVFIRLFHVKREEKRFSENGEERLQSCVTRAEFRSRWGTFTVFLGCFSFPDSGQYLKESQQIREK